MDESADEKEQASKKPTGQDLLHNIGGQTSAPGCFSPLSYLAVLALVLVASAIVPNFVRARAQGRMTACPSNLKNIGTACEMYSADWRGDYPTSMSLLTPNYLKTVPECPSVGEITYRMETGAVAYNFNGFEDYYFIYCAGPNHTSVSVPANYPQYDSIQGLISR